MFDTLITLGIGTAIPLIVVRILDVRTPTTIAAQRIILGILILVPAIILQRQLMAVVEPLVDSPDLKRAIKGFLIYGLCEEVLRFLAIYFLTRTHKPRDCIDVVASAVWISIGFAIAENAMYLSGVSGHPIIGLAIARVLLPTLMHICCGVIVAASVLRLVKMGAPIAFLSAVALHGYYEWEVLSTDTSLGHLLMILAIAIGVSFVIIGKARAVTRQD